MTEIGAKGTAQRILVVDDSTSNLQLLSSLLTASGYTVYPASDGELALEFVRRTLPDLVLLDIRMPGMDGYEVCRRLKANEATRPIPIIFISILEDEREKVKGFQAGGVDYITKPFQQEEVLARIGVHLRLRELTEKLEQTVAARTSELRAANAHLRIELAERARAEEALRRSETLLNATQRLARTGGWEWDLERQTAFFTEETYRLLGFEPLAHTSDSTDYMDRSLACYDPEDRSVLLAALKRCGAQGDAYDLELPFTSTDGCRKWIRTTATAVREAGRIGKVVGLVMDITEAKQAAAELARHREQLEILVRERTAELESARRRAQQYLDVACVMLVAIDADRRVSLINQKGCDVLGIAPDGIVGRDWFQAFVPGGARESALEAFRRLVAGEIAPEGSVEGPVLTHSGEKRLIDWHNVVLRDEAGAIVGILASGEDVTERRRAEEQVKSLNRDLRERAAALEVANKELEAFAYSVSHDLRAPLRHIDCFVELLRKKAEGALDQESQHYMANISASAKKAGELIDDLLSFSRTSRQEMSVGGVDLGEMVRSIIRDAESDCARRKVEWRTSKLPKVTGDPSMLRIVLTNLVSNAVKFTLPREHAVIEIGSRLDEGEAIIFVRDNGVGFDPAYAHKLFGVFHRLHAASEFEGTGVGLAIAKRILQRHGGRIWAEGELGAGATFFFALPHSA